MGVENIFEHREELSLRRTIVGSWSAARAAAALAGTPASGRARGRPVLVGAINIRRR